MMRWLALIAALLSLGVGQTPEDDCP